MKKDLDCLGFDNCVVNIVTHELFDETTWNSTAAPRHNVAGVLLLGRQDRHALCSIAWCSISWATAMCTPALWRSSAGFFTRLRSSTISVSFPCSKGDTGTGKSTVLTVIKRLFAPAAVGVLNSNNEVTFGLESKYDKELLIAHEIGDRLTDRLSSDLFKQMVCGEDISIPRKNKGAH